MDTNIVYTIDKLTADAVSIKTQEAVVIDGLSYTIGEPHRKAYTNDEDGISELENDIPDPYKSAILSIWQAEESE